MRVRPPLSLEGSLTAEQREQASSAAHKLAGVLGTFGLDEGTNLAREAEILYSSGSGGGSQLRVSDLRKSRCNSRPCSLRESNAEGHQQLHSSLVTLQNPSARQLDFTFEEPQSARRVWPVRELVERVRELVEQRHSDVWVEGEISNLRPAPSGHLYFTLKDAEAQLACGAFPATGAAASFSSRGRTACAGAGPGKRLRAARPTAIGRRSHGAGRGRIAATCV